MIIFYNIVVTVAVDVMSLNNSNKTLACFIVVEYSGHTSVTFGSV